MIEIGKVATTLRDLLVNQLQLNFKLWIVLRKLRRDCQDDKRSDNYQEHFVASFVSVTKRINQQLTHQLWKLKLLCVNLVFCLKQTSGKRLAV